MSGAREVELKFKIKNAQIATPRQCRGNPSATIGLHTQVMIDDGVNEPVELTALHDWVCEPDKHGDVVKLSLDFRQ